MMDLNEILRRKMIKKRKCILISILLGLSMLAQAGERTKNDYCIIGLGAIGMITGLASLIAAPIIATGCFGMAAPSLMGGSAACVGGGVSYALGQGVIMLDDEKIDDQCNQAFVISEVNRKMAALATRIEQLEMNRD
jgi:hypothetical protein